MEKFNGESGHRFVGLNFSPMLRLIAATYLSRCLKLFPAKDVETIHSSLSQHPIDPEYTRACSILKITNLPLTSLSMWLETVRQITSRMNKTDIKELFVMPNETSLKFHFQCTEFVCHYCFQSTLFFCNERENVENFGWKRDILTSKLLITWDTDVTSGDKVDVGSEKGCGCGKGG